MKTFTKLDPIVQQVVKKQFVCAGYKDLDLKTVDFMGTKKPWYHVYTWTTEQRDTFKEWLYNKLIKNKEYREHLIEIPNLKTKKRMQQVTDEWDFQYGFKIS